MSCRFFFFFLTLRARRADAQTRSRPAAQNHTQNIKFFTTLQLHLSPIYPPFIPHLSPWRQVHLQLSANAAAYRSRAFRRGVPLHTGPGFAGLLSFNSSSAASAARQASYLLPLRLVANLRCVWLRLVAFGCDMLRLVASGFCDMLRFCHSGCCDMLRFCHSLFFVFSAISSVLSLLTRRRRPGKGVMTIA